MDSPSYSDETVDDLVDLFVYGSILPKSAEVEWAATSTFDASKEPKRPWKIIEYRKKILRNVPLLSRFISPTRVDSTITNKQLLVDSCTSYAKEYLERSCKPIFPGNPNTVRYSHLRSLLETLMGSSYADDSPAIFEYSTALIAIYWDFENAPLPKNFKDIAKLLSNIKKVLRSMGFSGMVEMTAVGSITDHISPANLNALEKQGICVLDTPSEQGIKDTADKRCIAKMTAWAQQQLRDQREPANVVAITGDIDFHSALQTLHNRKFKIILAYGNSPSQQLLNAKFQTVKWQELHDGVTS